MKATVRVLALIVVLVAGILTGSAPAQADEPAAEAVANPPDVYGWSINVNAPHYGCLQPAWVADGAPIVFARCSARSNTWDLIHRTDGRYFIRVSGTNKCLTTPSWADFHAVLYECYGYANQQWIPQKLDPAAPTWGVVKFRNVEHQGHCLTGPTWANGYAVLYNCLNFADQRWWVRPS